MKKIAFLAISFAILAACTNEVAETPISFTRELTFRATQEGLSPETKTMRMDDGSTWWQPNEEISVFYGRGSAGGSKFTSQNSTLQETVEFNGSIQISGSGKGFWAVYPYSEDNECDGSSITTVIPAVQTGSEGNFSGDAFPTMANSKTLELGLDFWNICGGIKFSVSRNDIKSVTFKGNAGEILAGKVRVAFSKGTPEVSEVLDGKSEVTLRAPEGGTFKAGKYYYLSLLPAELEDGFTITFNTATEQGTVVSINAQTVKRSIFGVLNSIDSMASEWESTVVEPEYVDLGLSVKWASFNLGTYKPEGYGDYYAWGETEPYYEYGGAQSSNPIWRPGIDEGYDWLNYKWCNGSIRSLTKYCLSSSENYWGGAGLPDNKTQLDLADDAAHVNWGGNWRMPTTLEQDELRLCCTWQWTDNYNDKGVSGYIIKSNVPGCTDISIFLPAAGYRDCLDLFDLNEHGFYWSSSLSNLDEFQSYYSLSIYLLSSSVHRHFAYRHLGYTIRPVYDDRIHPESISLNKSTLSLIVSDSEQLIASISPSNATDKSLFWSSDNPDVANVDNDGKVTAVATGTATITVTTNDGGLTASCAVTVSLPEPEAVDLGLSVKWASFNLGATKPEMYGDYYAWGEIEPYYENGYAQSESPVWKPGKESGYAWKSYRWADESWIYKYNEDESKGIVDNLSVLQRGEKEGETIDDAARANLGLEWRMPTFEEWEELIDNCSWTWTTRNGVEGFLVQSTNNAGFIFLPASGYRIDANYYGNYFFGDYWSASFSDKIYARAVTFSSNGISTSSSSRYQGYSVRAVSGPAPAIPVFGISLKESLLSMTVGETKTLTATIIPSDATNQNITWSTSNSSVATVDANGLVTAISSGSVTITVSAEDNHNLEASCTIKIKNPSINGYEYVDLGLSVLWATCNVGATKPEEYGGYFAWGETEPKDDYSWLTYTWCNGDYNKLTKYCIQSSYWDSTKPMDNKTTLDLEDDTAHVTWGGSWRMPTYEEWWELSHNCTWTWATQNGINGRLVTGPNGNSIFLPAAGCWVGANLRDAGSGGSYWSSSLAEDSPCYAWSIGLASDVDGASGYRCFGRSVRPVCPKD